MSLSGGILLLLALLCAFSSIASPLETIRPLEDTNAVLHNPDMGWVLYENYALDSAPGGSSTLVNLPNEAFPEVDAVALMFSWQDIEKSEGDYDFSKADFAYDFWKKRGKSIQLRLSTTSLLWWAARNPAAGKGAPDYVLQKLSAAEKQTRTMEGIPYAVEDARNLFYRARLEKFLGAVASHYGNERPVSLIDLRGFGLWGEWHSGFRYRSLEERRTALKQILDIWSFSFPNHFLALSYSYDPDGPKDLYAGPYKNFDPSFTSNYASFLEFSAFDYALTKTNITFRRDGCGGAVHSNERLLNEKAFNGLNRGPFVSEFLGGFGSVKKAGTNWVNWMIEDALSLHPNYMNLLGWQSTDALRFIRERPDLVAQGLVRMGYRLMPLKIAYPMVIAAGEPFQLETEWLNRGVGRTLQDLQLTLELRKKGETFTSQSVPVTLPCSRWVKGEKYPATLNASFRNPVSGDYQLSFSLRNNSGRNILLPIRLQQEQGSYKLGPIRVQ